MSSHSAMRAVVIGTGLIGTSLALALRERGSSVWLADVDPAAARLACDLGAGDVLPDPLGDSWLPADVAVIAVPPAAVAATLADAQARGVARCYTDVASVKQFPVAQARARGCDLASYVPGHPLAGREKHGPAAARADLFLGRAWALCPAPETAPAATEAVTDLVRACGAIPVRTDAAAHDRWVALISHAPHVVAAAMAARLEVAPQEALDLAGQGLRDVTRIAAGDTGLWTQILAANATPVAEVLAAVAADLAEAARVLTEGERGEKLVAALLDRGQAGVARIPGKHGGAARQFTAVQVVIRDQPGELARLFQAVGAAEVNVEDVRIEHSPGLPVGVAEISVRPAEAAALLRALQVGGWPVNHLKDLKDFYSERTAVLVAVWRWGWAGPPVASVGDDFSGPGKRYGCRQ
jgi:prephenate dehydrogenase